MKNIIAALALASFFATSTFANVGEDKDKKAKKSCCTKMAGKSSCSKETAAKKSCNSAKAEEKAS